VLHEASWLALTKADLMRLAELVALALVALMLILLVVRPMLRRLLPSPGPAVSGAPALPAARGTAAALADRQTPALAPPAGGRAGHAGAGGEADGAAPDLEARGELIKRARAMIDQSPDEAAALVRSWLYES
jgi:flagellar M-ring protein FliF